MLSMSVRIEAPVVVKPDITSKYASVNEGKAPERVRGRDPINAAKIQLNVTKTKPSLVDINSVLSFLKRYKKINASEQDTAITITKALKDSISW